MVEKLLMSNETEVTPQALISQDIADDTVSVLHPSAVLDNPSDQEKMSLLNEIASLKMDIENLRKKTNIENNKLKEFNETLLGQIDEMKTNEKSLKKFQESVQNIFTPGQIRRMQNPCARKLHWNVKDIAHAITLHAAGPRVYMWMQKNHHPLPGESTLRRWANKKDVSPGILGFVFTLMESYSLSDLDKVCIILADEMKVKKSYEYDRNCDTLLKPANYVQVIMARGVFCNWKQPLFYDFDRTLNKSLLFQIIRKLETIGFKVIAITNDLGGGNRGLWKSLGITEESPFFLHPDNYNERIYAFADVPHLVKLLRNHFLDSEFIIHGKTVTKKPLLERIEHSQGIDLNIAHKLTIHHLTVKNAGRQKVTFATQLFSHTNSKAILRMSSLGLLRSGDWQECANLLKTVNDWFDIFNTRLPKKDPRDRIKAYDLAKDIQDKIIDEMKNVISNLKVGKSNSNLPFQKGILISSNAQPMLFNDLIRKYDIKYLLTYRLNQDPLEGFFGILRAIGGLHDHPTGLEFKYRLRNYLLGRNETILSESMNVMPDDTENNSNVFKDLPTYFERANNFGIEEEPITITSNLLEHITEARDPEVSQAEFESTFSELECDSIENIAGYIAATCQGKPRS